MCFLACREANKIHAQNIENGQSLADATRVIFGTVADTSGASIASATVDVICGGSHIRAHTDQDGKYRLELPPTACWLEVRAPSFEASDKLLVVLQDREAESEDFVLKPAKVLGSVTVSPKAEFGDTITNVGTKTNGTLIGIPQSISVVPREQLARQHVQSVAESMRYSAGVFAEPRIDSVFDTTFIRGFGGFAATANFVGFLDGLQLQKGMNWAVPTVDPYTLERVVLLRGPSSVLYGETNPGGLVNLVSKKPENILRRASPAEAPTNELVIQSGDRNRIQGTLDVGGVLRSNGALAYRLIGVARRNDTQVDYSQEQRFVLAPSVSWRLDHNTSLTFLMNLQRDPSNNVAGWLPAQGTVLPNAEGKIRTSFDPGQPDFDVYDRSQVLTGYQFEHHFTPASILRQNFRYEHLDTKFKGVAVNFTNPFGATASTLNRYALWSGEHLNSIVVDSLGEIHLATAALSHTIVAGATYARSTATIKQSAYGLVQPIDYLSPAYNDPISAPAVAQSTLQIPIDIGPYLQDEIRFGKLTLLVGGRQDWVHTDTTDRIYSRTTPQNEHAFTGRAGVAYLFGSGLAPYVNYSTSFQPVTGVDYNGKAFVPTRARQIEGGVKYQPHGLQSFITASVFDITQKNVSTTDPDHPNYSVQRGTVRSRGSELEAHVAPTAHLRVIAAYTYVNPTVTADPDASIVGNRLLAVPQHMGSLWLDYSLPGKYLSGMEISGGTRYTGSSAGDSANSFDVPGTALMDITWRYEPVRTHLFANRWNYTVNATNLLDKRYVASCFSAGGCFYGNRRVVKLSVGYRW